jgi:large subunit ribosomal protein L15
MVTNKRKKVVKYRAHTTHGGGHRKKRRGAGSRGGRGNAGTGKRAGQKVASGKVLTPRKGFRPRRMDKLVTSVNVGYFTATVLDQLIEKGQAKKTGDLFDLDLSKLGFTKLLGAGNVASKLKIHVAHHSAQAADKIKTAGGEVIPITKKEKSVPKNKDLDSEKPKSAPEQ